MKIEISNLSSLLVISIVHSQSRYGHTQTIYHYVIGHVIFVHCHVILTFCPRVILVRAVTKSIDPNTLLCLALHGIDNKPYGRNAINLKYSDYTLINFPMIVGNHHQHYTIIIINFE